MFLTQMAYILIEFHPLSTKNQKIVTLKFMFPADHFHQNCQFPSILNLNFIFNYGDIKDSQYTRSNNFDHFFNISS